MLAARARLSLQSFQMIGGSGVLPVLGSRYFWAKRTGTASAGFVADTMVFVPRGT